MTELILIGSGLALVAWLLLYMFAQKPESSVQALIQRGEYLQALQEADRMLASDPANAATWLHRAEAAKLHGALEEARRAYEEVLRLQKHDAAAEEGLALTLTHLQRDPERARTLMEEALQSHPEIQEFQALSLAYILQQQGRREEALRLFEDNRELLQTRFAMDYTDPDPLLAETLFLYATLTAESGDADAARELFRRATLYAPRSLIARWVASRSDVARSDVASRSDV